MAGVNCSRHGYSPVTPCQHCEAYEAKLKADARAEGRQEGLLEAVRRLRESTDSEVHYAADELDKLIEAEKGGGGR